MQGHTWSSLGKEVWAPGRVKGNPGHHGQRVKPVQGHVSSFGRRSRLLTDFKKASGLLFAWKSWDLGVVQQLGRSLRFSRLSLTWGTRGGFPR